MAGYSRFPYGDFTFGLFSITQSFDLTWFNFGKAVKFE